MRILFTVSSGLGHLFPVIPTAWALRAAGHEVLIATTGNTEYAANAGLPAYDVAPNVDLTDVLRGFIGKNANEFRGALDADPETGTRFAARLFAAMSDAMADGIVRLGQRWGPDLVVHTTLQGAGPLVAALLGVPAIEHSLLLAGSEIMTTALREAMADTYSRHGVTDPPPSRAILDVVPASMSMGERGLAMRYLTYNSGCVVPEWLLREPERPRIAVTFGTMPAVGAPNPLPSVVKAAGDVDAEFVLALGGMDAPDDLPDNVRSIGWLPLGALLPTCVAQIHHGGSGTTFAALVAGVPQLVVPSGADQVYNSRVVAKRGLGLVAKSAEVDADLITRLLTDSAMRSVAREVAEEIATRPAPVDLVPAIVALGPR